MTGPGGYRDDEHADDYGETPLDRLGFSSGSSVRGAPHGVDRRTRSRRLLVGVGAAAALLLVVITATELVGHQSAPISAADPGTLTGAPPTSDPAPTLDAPTAAPPVFPPAPTASDQTPSALPPSTAAPGAPQLTSPLPPPPQAAPSSSTSPSPDTTSTPAGPESNPAQSTEPGSDRGTAASPSPGTEPTSGLAPTVAPTRDPAPSETATSAAGPAPSSTLLPIPPSTPAAAAGGSGDDRAVVRIVRRGDGTSIITVTIGATTIGPVIVPTDATTSVPRPPVHLSPQPTVPPTTTTTPPSSTNAPDTTTPDVSAAVTPTLVPGKAPPDTQTPANQSPDDPSSPPSPGSVTGTATGATSARPTTQPTQTTVPGKAPVDGQAPDSQAPGITQTSEPQAAGGQGAASSPDNTTGGTGGGPEGTRLAPDAGAPGTFEVVPSPGNDVQQTPARARTRTSRVPANTIEPGGHVIGTEEGFQPPVVVQSQVNLAESTPDSSAATRRTAAGWLAPFALGALAASGVFVAVRASRRRGQHTGGGR